MTYWYPAYQRVISLLKERFSKSPIILGGNYAHLAFEHAVSQSGADLVFKGVDPHEAVLFIDKSLGGKLSVSPDEKWHDIFPAYDLYPKPEYITLKTSHGCPFRCTYCGWYLVDDRFTREDPGFVVNEINYFHNVLGVKNFAFYDDALLYNAEDHFIKIARGIIERGITANFLTPNGLHNRFLTKDVACAMRTAGFVKPRLALETSSSERQKNTGGKTTNEEFLSALDNLLEAGYERRDIGVYILIGLPGQSVDEVEDTARFASSSGVRIHLEEYSPIPGTADYKKSGLRPDADPLLHNNSAFPLYSPGFFPEIQRLKELVRFFNR